MIGLNPQTIQHHQPADMAAIYALIALVNDPAAAKAHLATLIAATEELVKQKAEIAAAVAGAVKQKAEMDALNARMAAELTARETAFAIKAAAKDKEHAATAVSLSTAQATIETRERALAEKVAEHNSKVERIRAAVAGG